MESRTVSQAGRKGSVVDGQRNTTTQRPAQPFTTARPQSGIRSFAVPCKKVRWIDRVKAREL